MIFTSNLAIQEKKERHDNMINKLMWLPLCILLGIVPLIVKMVLFNTELSSGVIDALNTTEVGDAYSNYKSTAIIVLLIIMGLILFLCFDKTMIKFDKTILVCFIGIGIYIGIGLIATVLSDESHVAWSGMPDRAEGMIMLICYVLLLAYTMYVIRGAKDYRYIVLSLSFMIVMNTIIGAFQFFGYDLFMNVDAFKNFILGEECLQKGYTLTSDYSKGRVFGTLAHYNYMGTFGAMMVPFFGMLTVLIKEKRKKMGLALVTVCSMFLLFGSTSRGGIVGLVLAMVVGIAVFIKPIIRKWKITVPVVIALVTVLFVFNTITKGVIFERIPTLVNDAVGMFVGSDDNFDYKDHIPIREITHEGTKEKIVLQKDVLYIGYDSDFIFSDAEESPIDYQMDNKGNYTTSDPRYANIRFVREEVLNAKGGKAPLVISLIYNDGTKEENVFSFMLDETEGVVLADACPLEKMEIVEAPAFGFKGKEKLGSQRGYIWSRSIPMMKKTWLIGNGPDTFAIYFPQDDLLGKWWAYDTPNMIVDKAHNLYLNIWINLGGTALIGFLVMIIAYLIQSLKLYALKARLNEKEAIGAATMLAIIGYLGASVFNDPVVSVEPVFWVLLGAGMGVNYLISREVKEV